MSTSLDKPTNLPPHPSPAPTNGNGSNGNGLKAAVQVALSEPRGQVHFSGHSVAEVCPGTDAPVKWSPAQSASLYGIRNWGAGYFSVNEQGHVVVHPNPDLKQTVDLKTLVDELRERDIQLPCLIRFTDILKHRVGQLHAAFENAIKEHDYKG